MSYETKIKSLLLIIVAFFSFVSPCFALKKECKPKKYQKDSFIRLEKELSSLTVSEKDQICGYLQKDLVSKYKVVLPANSYLCGEVSKVKKASRFSRNAGLIVHLKKIVTADARALEVSGVDFKVTVPTKYQYKRDIPGAIAYAGAFFPVQFATSLCSFAADAIGMGAGTVIGAAYGAIFPEEGKTRGRSSLDCAINASPIGLVLYVVKKGKNFEYSQYDNVYVKFSKKELKQIYLLSSQDAF